MQLSKIILIFLLISPELAFAVENSDFNEVSANEDLMREHGLLNRLLLIYQEIAKRLEKNTSFSIDTLQQSAQIVRDFIENYHEKLEENYIFPVFENANQLVDLVTTLRTQHQAGRQLTDLILANANKQSLSDPQKKQSIVTYLNLFIRMYRPHEAREDTILFPALHKMLSSKEYARLGEEFEKKEKELFGEDGFEKNLNAVAAIEKQLGIYNLSQFTPHLGSK